jgi:hypothetical protein
LLSAAGRDDMLADDGDMWSEAEESFYRSPQNGKRRRMVSFVCKKEKKDKNNGNRSLARAFQEPSNVLCCCGLRRCGGDAT